MNKMGLETPTHLIIKRGSMVLTKLLIGSNKTNLMIGDKETELWL